MLKNKFKTEIDKIKNDIINYSLIVGSVIGVIVYFIGLTDIKHIGFKYSYIADFIIVLTLSLLTIFRHKILLKNKIIIILVSIFILVLFDTYTFGIVSYDKMFLILIPLFSLFVFNIKQTVIIFFISLSLYTSIILLQINGVLQISDYNITTKLFFLAITLLIIIIVASTFVIIFKVFNNKLLKFIEELELKNKEISQKEQSYREIFNSSIDAIFIFDFKGKILDFNKSSLIMFGYENISVDNINLSDLSANVDDYTVEKAAENIRYAIKNGFKTFDWLAKHQSGKLFWVEVALKRTFILGQERVLAVVRNIDERKRALLELEKYKNKLELLVIERTKELENVNEELNLSNVELFAQRNELKAALDELQAAQNKLIETEKMASLGVLAAGISHEINNPLNFIQGGVTGLEFYLADKKINDNDVQMLINAIKEGVFRAADIVKSLNHYCRQADNIIEDCDIHQIIENALTIIKGEIKNRIDIEKYFINQKVIIKCDEGKLHQVVVNILTNAMQAIDDKGCIKINTHTENNYIIIKIKDTGKGIKKENLSKITDPFFTTKEQGEGAGLGLSIAKNIIEEHNGSIEFESELGKGTEVTIYLPIYEN